MTEAGSLSFAFNLDTSKFDKQIKDVKSKFSGFDIGVNKTQKSMQSLGNTVGGIFSTMLKLSALSLGGFGLLANKISSYAFETSKTAKLIGSTEQRLQQIVNGIRGFDRQIPKNDILSSIQNLSSLQGNIKIGKSGIPAIFNFLGLSNKLLTQSPEEFLFTVLKKLNELTDPAQRAELLKETGVSTSLNGFNKSQSQVLAKGAELAIDQKAIDNFKDINNQIGIILDKLIKRFTEFINEFKPVIDLFLKEIENFIDKFTLDNIRKKLGYKENEDGTRNFLSIKFRDKTNERPEDSYTPEQKKGINEAKKKQKAIDKKDLKITPLRKPETIQHLQSTDNENQTLKNDIQSKEVINALNNNINNEALNLIAENTNLTANNTNLTANNTEGINDNFSQQSTSSNRYLTQGT